VYGLARGWSPEVILEFSCAAAALNCLAEGARGGIASLATIEDLRRTCERSEAAFPPETLDDAALAAKSSGAARKP
jgi:sulfofructose kinase